MTRVLQLKHLDPEAESENRAEIFLHLSTALMMLEEATENLLL